MRIIKRKKGKILILGNRKFKYIETHPKLSYHEVENGFSEEDLLAGGISFYVSSVEERKEIKKIFDRFGIYSCVNKINNIQREKFISPIHEDPIRGLNHIYISITSDDIVKFRRIIKLIRKELRYKIRYKFKGTTDIIV